MSDLKIRPELGALALWLFAASPRSHQAAAKGPDAGTVFGYIIVALFVILMLALLGRQQSIARRDREWSDQECNEVSVSPAGFVPAVGERVLYGFRCARCWLPKTVTKSSGDTRGIIFGGVAVGLGTNSRSIGSTEMHDCGIGHLIVTNHRVILFVGNDVLQWPRESVIGYDLADQRIANRKVSPGLITLQIANIGRVQLEIFHVNALHSAMRLALTGEV